MIVLLHMEIIEETYGGYLLKISERDSTSAKAPAHVFFHPVSKALQFQSVTPISDFLKENEYQFRKLLHNKKSETYHIGFTLDFSIIPKKDIAKFNDKGNTVVTDSGTVYVIKSGREDLLEIYTDGSFDELSETGACGYAIVKDGAILSEHYTHHPSMSSSHLELMAVISALEEVQTTALRIYTDSQYVRKGITEWIWHWQANGFMTANGTKAKNIDDWNRLDHLISDRYIEWVWLKAHRDNQLHNHVDRRVRAKAKGML